MGFRQHFLSFQIIQDIKLLDFCLSSILFRARLYFKIFIFIYSMLYFILSVQFFLFSTFLKYFLAAFHVNSSQFHSMQLPLFQQLYKINYIIFQLLMQKSEQQLKFKIIIAGDSGVGKSNLRNRFCQGTFDPFSNSTVGIQYSKRHFWAPIQGKTSKLITICFWDAAGKFNQNQLLPSFFKNIVGIIYVYDMSKQQSLQNLKMWKSLITDHINVNKVTQMLIGNKSDLVFLRQVAIYQAQKIKKQLKIPLYFQTSALQNINVNQAFYAFISEIMKESATGINAPIKIKKRQTHMRSCF